MKTWVGRIGFGVLALLLAGFIALFFIVTIVKLGGNVANRPI